MLYARHSFLLAAEFSLLNFALLTLRPQALYQLPHDGYPHPAVVRLTPHDGVRFLMFAQARDGILRDAPFRSSRPANLNGAGDHPMRRSATKNTNAKTTLHGRLHEG